MNYDDNCLQLFDTPPDTPPSSQSHQETNSATISNSGTPLAYALRPTSFEDYIGQSHLIGPGKPLRKLIDSHAIGSLILWGPPGCGKTALSRLISAYSKGDFISLNAVTAKLSDIKTVIQRAKSNLKIKRRTFLFIDEIHRFNKAQQDALLPDVETGLVTFIGATTENPFFSVIPGLISRALIFELVHHSTEDLKQLIERACTTLDNAEQASTSTSTSVSFTIHSSHQDILIGTAKGDARKLLNFVAAVHGIWLSSGTITDDDINGLTSGQGIPSNTNDHYDLISAYIKSMRGSDEKAALYWLARLLKSGEDPAFIWRRLMIFASEDIGLADPNALAMAAGLKTAVDHIGMPEVQINLAHVSVAFARAKKDNTSYMGIREANGLIDQGVMHQVPDHLRDAHYKGAKAMGFGDGYVYPHSDPEGAKTQRYLP